MKTDLQPATPPPAILSEKFLTLTPEENELLLWFESAYSARRAEGEARTAQGFARGWAQIWGELEGRAIAGDKAAMEEMRKFGSAANLENLTLVDERARWTALGREFIRRWENEVRPLAARIAARAAEILADYRSSPRPWHDLCGVAAPRADEITDRLIRMQSACAELEAGPPPARQLTEPPRPGSLLSEFIVNPSS